LGGKKLSGSMGKRSRRKLLFYVCVLALPVLQFCVFYIGVNVNSMLLAFKSYDYYTGQYNFVMFDNFKRIFDDFQTVQYMAASVKNSLFLYLFTIIGTVLSVFFSYYIYKKHAASGVFRVILFLPQIISAIVMVVMFKYFVERAIPFALEKLTGQAEEGLLANSTAFGTIIFYCVWSGFGTSVLMFSGAMHGISDSVTEAAKLDGITPLKEFIHITVPLIYPTLTIFIVVGVAGIFTNQMNLFSFYGESAEYNLYTFGYFLYKGIKTASISDYPYLSAMGLLLTVIAVPLTLIVKKVLEKVGPKTY
jgi:ABC-type sugar transport system permease subunit